MGPTDRARRRLRPARLSAAIAGLAAMALIGLPGPAATAASAGPTAAGMFSGCTPAGRSMKVTVGRVACQEMATRLLGGTTAFAYFVPPACAPDRHRRCPVLYLLHGFGGDYTSMLGTASAPSAWVASLDRSPPVPPEQSPSPWTESDSSKWVGASPLAMILVAPDGRTTPGGYGPQAGLDGYWADWNPRYAAGGDEQSYDTPAPRFAGFVAQELVPFIDAHLPVGRGRDWQALAGTSLGGYGSYAIGLAHPDQWASLGAVSGIMNILLLPGLDPSASAAPVGLQAPVDVGYGHLPGHLVPLGDLPGPAQDFGAATYVFGDPSVDQAYYRGNQPVDLAFNALADGPGGQSVYIRGFSNDAVPRQASDLSSPSGYLGAQAFESLVLATNTELNQSFNDVGAQYSYQRHPGIHEDAYWNPWLREQEVAQYARLAHWNGGGAPPAQPTSFSYRSIYTSFSIWGWHVSVQRPDVEFLQMSAVSCSAFTLRGSGTVTVTVPGSCHSGVAGHNRVTVDLGPSMPVDAQGGTDASSAYGRTATVHLTPLR